MKILLLLPLLLGFSVPAIAHNKWNGGECVFAGECQLGDEPDVETEEGEEGEEEYSIDRHGEGGK